MMAKSQPGRSTPGATPAKAVRAQQTDAPAAGDEADEEIPMNRAARRAKGRGKTTGQVSGVPAKVTGGHGPAHTQRNWANRRSG